MATYQQILDIIVDSLGELAPHDIVRQEYDAWLKRHLNNKFIKVITGFRRVGKSYLLKQLYHHLLTTNVSQKNIFFINFENPLLINNRTVLDLKNMFDVFLQNSEQSQPVYLFLDEIQNVPQWESFVRTIYDKNSNKYNIFITGSNSDLLSSEFSSSLGGRTVELSVNPFNFQEVLLFNKVSINDKNWDYIKEKKKVNLLLNNYINFGSFPETINLEKKSIRDYVQSVFQKVLLDDIIKRFNIDKAQIIEKVFYYLVSNVSNTISVSSIEKILKNQNDNISIPTLEQYISYYEAAFAITRVPKFSWKTKGVFHKLYKYYPVDSSFIQFFSIKRGDIHCKLLEAAVFNQLRRLYNTKNIYYGRDTNSDREIDFVVEQDSKEFLKIQVAWELNEVNKKRELGNFALVNKYLKKGRNLLITMADRNIVHKLGNCEVEEIPLWKFLLSEKRF